MDAKKHFLKEDIKSLIIDITDGMTGGEYQEFWEESEVDSHIERLFYLMKKYYEEGK